MWCGSGKTRVFFTFVLQQRFPLTVVAFPSLALIQQFSSDYLYSEEIGFPPENCTRPLCERGGEVENVRSSLTPLMLLLFDIDGTLTEPMQPVDPATVFFFQRLKAEHPDVRLGVLGGSDRSKALRQCGEFLLDEVFDICFHENGASCFSGGRLVHQKVLTDFVSQETLNSLLCFLMREFSELSDEEVPVRSGTFFERRACMLNVSPVGRACTQAEREAFFALDTARGVRARLVRKIKEAFPDLPLETAVGGQISIDVFPKGMDKSYALQFVKDTDIYFFGDRCEPGGNDYEVYTDSRVTGVSVTGPKDTLAKVEEVLSRPDQRAGPLFTRDE